MGRNKSFCSRGRNKSGTKPKRALIKFREKIEMAISKFAQSITGYLGAIPRFLLVAYMLITIRPLYKFSMERTAITIIFSKVFKIFSISGRVAS